MASRSTQFVPVAVDSPPPPQQTTTERHYVPFEVDNFRKAHGWACEQLARKYPGVADYLTHLESLTNQYLAGAGKK